MLIDPQTAPDLLAHFQPRSVVVDGRRRSVVTMPRYRQGMKPPNAGKRYPAEVLSRDEIHRLMAELGRGYAGARNRAIVVVMWRCGLRIAEVLALRPKDVDLQAGTITVLHGKGDRRRVVGLDPEAAAVLEIWLHRRGELAARPSQPLFCVISRPAIGKTVYASTIREALKDAAAKAGIEKRVHPHGLRHTFASELMAERIPMNVIRELLGHASIATTARYVDHLSPWEAIRVQQARTWTPVTPALPAGPAVVLAQ